MVTLKEIAKECNVSAATVSNILNGKPNVSEETRQKVLAVVEQRGYHPNYIARGLRVQKTKMIGIIVEDIAQFSIPPIVEGIMSFCEEKGYSTMVQNLRLYARWNDSWFDNETDYFSTLEPVVQELQSIKVDGIIYVAGHARVIKGLKDKMKIPMVMTYAYTESEQIPSVVLDDEKGGYDMTKYLIHKGHNKIGVIAGKANNIHTQKRLLGYQRAIFEHQILFNPGILSYGTWERPSGYEAAKDLIQAGVTAIFCFCDRMAGGVYDYVHEQGMNVGEDISVVGYDNQDLSEYFQPGLTTMKLPLTEIGHRAARILVDRLENDEIASSTVQNAGNNAVEELLVPCSLMERKSVKKI